MTGLRIWAWVGVVASLCGAGCQRKAPAPLPTYEVAFTETTSTAGEAPDAYRRAGEAAEAAAPKYIRRSSFTPKMRELATEQVGKAIQIVARGAISDPSIAFEPSRPFEPRPYRLGWRLIGRVLAWRIADKCAAEDFDGAVSDAVVATKFGTGLLSGSATDATMGIRIIDDAREAVAPYLTKLEAEQLQKLADGYLQALEQRPDLRVTLEHEHQNMVLAVKFVQDSYTQRKWDQLRSSLGVDAREGIDFLQALEPSAAPAYFEGFLAEAKEQTQSQIAMAEQPLALRSEALEPKMASYRPWKRLARNFFTSGNTLIEMNDRNLARTRLMVYECLLTKESKTKRTLPSKLSLLDLPALQDPFSGGDFMYRVDGLNFAVYSVGENLLDDGGETDGEFAKPDLMVERGR